MTFFKTLALGTAALTASVTMAFAEPREVRIASHVSEFSPLHAQSRSGRLDRDDQCRLGRHEAR